MLISSFDGSFYGENLLLTGLEQSALFEYDFSKEQLMLRSRLPENIEIVDTMVYGEELYLFPFFANYVYGLDLKSGEIKKLKRQGTKEYEGTDKTRINRPIMLQDRVYIFPVYMERELTMLDLKSGELHLLEGWWSQLAVAGDVLSDHEFMVIYAFERFWVMRDGASVLYEFSTDLKLIELHQFAGYSFYGINADEQGIWIILHNSGDLLHWNVFSGELNIYREATGDTRDFQYVQIAGVEDKVFVLPYNNERIALVDKKNKRICNLEMPEGVYRLQGNVRPLYNKYIVRGRKIYFVPLAANCILVYDLEEQSMKSYETSVAQEAVMQLLGAVAKDEMISEKNYSLQEFIRFVASQD